MQQIALTIDTFTLGLKDISNVVVKLQNIIQDLQKDNNIFLLKGDLSSGKTTLVKQYVALFNNDLVTSPTFSIIHEYKNNIFHYDLYQKSWSELLSLGILDYLDKDGVHFVEWSNQELEDTLKSFDVSPIVIDIDYASLDKRVYNISYE